MSLVKQNISYKYYVIRLSYPSSQNSDIYILKSCTSGGRYPFHLIIIFRHYTSADSIGKGKVHPRIGNKGPGEE